jgi:hypothetical protein
MLDLVHRGLKKWASTNPRLSSPIDKSRASTIFKSCSQINCVCVSDRRQKKLQDFIHEHPLFYCKVSDPLICNGCGEGIQDSCYGCEDCHFDFLLHESCVEQLSELSHENLQHPIDSKHPLIFTKHHHMIRGPAHAISAVTLAKGLFITVPIANLTLISNVLYYHSPLKLKFTTTH